MCVFHRFRYTLVVSQRVSRAQSLVQTSLSVHHAMPQRRQVSANFGLDRIRSLNQLNCLAIKMPHLKCYCKLNFSGVPGQMVRTVNHRLRDSTWGGPSRASAGATSSEDENSRSETLTTVATIHGEMDYSYSPFLPVSSPSPTTSKAATSGWKFHSAFIARHTFRDNIKVIESTPIIPKQEAIQPTDRQPSSPEPSKPELSIQEKPEKRARSLLDALDDEYYSSCPPKMKKSHPEDTPSVITAAVSSPSPTVNSEDDLFGDMSTAKTSDVDSRDSSIDEIPGTPQPAPKFKAPTNPRQRSLLDYFKKT